MHLQALIESARSAAAAASTRGRDRRGLGPITLHLPFAAPFWKVLLGQPVTFDDLRSLDEAEANSLGALMGAQVRACATAHCGSCRLAASAVHTAQTAGSTD